MSSNEPRNPVVEPPRGPCRDETGSDALSLRVRQQENLAKLGVAALKGTPLDELLEEAARLSAQGLEAEFCKVLEHVPAENRLVMRAGVGWDEDLVGTASVGADIASPSGYALRTGKPVISNHLAIEERFRTPDLLAAHGVQRAINVILQGDGAPYGVLEVDSRLAGEFTERDIAFLQGTANILGMAIERQRQEQALKAALERQQVLLQEINHRVKNSLHLVAAMLRLQAGNDPHLGQHLHEASTRIMAIGRAHDRLYRSPQIEKIEMSAYLSDICNDLQQFIHNCDISCGASDEFFFNADRAIDTALVVTELITNAAKYAYPDGRRGPIEVSVRRVGETIVRISVRDEGSGLAPDFEAGTGDGFGMRLVKALVKQMRASFQVERHVRGTEFILEIPTDSTSYR